MTRYRDRDKVIELRKRGMSYSQIKALVPVSKSTLSLWLRDMPLSIERVRELRDFSEQRIEKTRETKRQKKAARQKSVYALLSKDLGNISSRELFVGGFFLYWGEGMKADPYTVMFTNTDPAMVRCFITWIQLLGVHRKELKVYLHLYEDMKVRSSIEFWSKELSIPAASFRKPYIKKTAQEKKKNYKGRFGHGTCNVYIQNRDIRERVGAGIVRLRELYGGVAFNPAEAL